MTSGFSDHYISETETLSIGNNAQPQSQYPDHPRKITGATGGFLNNYFITCGGDDWYEFYTDKCYKLGSDEPFATMMMKRGGAASIVLEAEKLWILGGYNGINDRLSSTEYIFSDGRTEEGPPMPIALSYHAMVKINETTSFLVGGFNFFNSKRSWFYNENWIDGPDLEIARFGLSLGIIRDSVTLREYVVAAGGVHDDSYLNDVEVLDIQENKWEQCKLLYL